MSPNSTLKGGVSFAKFRLVKQFKRKKTKKQGQDGRDLMLQVLFTSAVTFILPMYLAGLFLYRSPHIVYTVIKHWLIRHKTQIA